MFPPVDPVFEEAELEFKSEKSYSDITVRRYDRRETAKAVVHVFQKEKGSTQERLIQEYSHKK